MAERAPFSLSRQTRETDVRVTLGGTGGGVVLPVPLFRHFLSACLSTWGTPLALEALGDVEVDPHHLVEDVGIALGQALLGYFPGYREIARYGFALVPMDDALAEVALDLSGRAGCHLADLPEGQVAGLDCGALREFFLGLGRGGGLTLHVSLRRWQNAHHAWEAVFKALGLALRQATSERPREIVSTKGVIA